MIRVRLMRLLIFLVVFFACGSVCHGGYVFDEDEVYSKREIELFKVVRCMTCVGTSIHESGTEQAHEMRVYISGLLKRGLSDDEVLREVAKKYGEKALFKPFLSVSTVLLWLLPAILMVIILLIFRSFLRGVR